MKFTHLHVHSHYSLLDGLAKIDDLFERAKELGMTSLAITDHGALYGAIEFYIKAKEYGIKPIIGCEMYLTPNDLHSKNPDSLDRRRHHLILLAKNEKGYKNLMKLVSISHLEGFYYKPRIDKKVLRQYAEGLIGLSACIEGEVPATALAGDLEKAEKIALEYQDIFGADSFYLELQNHKRFPNQKIANDALIKISKKTGIPLVATNDIHYVKKEDAPIQDILLCIQTNRKVDEKDRINLMDFDLHMLSQEEMAENFKETPEALENTQKIVELCNLEIRLGETLLPYFEVPEGFDSKSYLRKLCIEGLKKRFGDSAPKKYIDRMEFELQVIEKTGFADYFLIVQDFVNWAKAQKIVVGPGRGSAAGSFVSYLIGITNIDPIKYDLLFERFLNPERISMPDVDMDFADDRRDEVLDYVRKKYGEDHVAQIITFGTMAARAAIRDAGRALGFPYEFCDKTAKMIPQFSNMADALINVGEFKDLYAQNNDAKKLIDSAKRLEGVIRHASMHACGVVITKKPVTEYSPLQRIIGKTEGTVTQYSSSTKSSFVEKIGLLKMDFLGLKNLTIIQNALRIAKKTKSLDLNIDDIPMDDLETFAILQKAHTTGVFQLESSGMKRYLKQLRPTVFEDIIAMVALYRPGPMDWIPDFIDRKHGRKEIKYLHPKLKDTLEKTYGVAVYQEQIMQIARDLAGFTMGEADVLRKAMGKKIVKLIEEQKEKFIQGCVKLDIQEKIAEKVFAFIEPFAGYGFNRSHAACYALIGYQTAFLKAHYPAEFMAALLTSDQDDIDRIAIEVSECREMGIEVLAPDVNESFEEFAVIIDPETKVERIRFGLNAVKNVGKTVAHEIVEERKRSGKFKNITNFVERVDSKDLNKKSIEALAKVGALINLGERNEIISSIDAILAHSKNFQKNKNSNQESLFGAAQISLPEIKLAMAIPADKKQCLSWEKELLGLYITDHPAREYAEYFGKMAIPIKDITNQMVGQNVTLGGIVTNIHKIFLKNQKTMLFVLIEDLSSKIELLIFPKVLDNTSGIWQDGVAVLATGKISDKDGNFKLLCDSVKKIDQAEMERFARIAATRQKNGGEKKEGISKIFISLPADSDQAVFRKISQFFDQCAKGETKVFITFRNSKLETPYRIQCSKEIIDSLGLAVPEGKVEII